MRAGVPVTAVVPVRAGDRVLLRVFAGFALAVAGSAAERESESDDLCACVPVGCVVRERG